ncbi:unnamed protein product [Rotaria sp. Silwood2]|nr:unnamed protein product [Rotaria sp. Silwood2]
MKCTSSSAVSFLILKLFSTEFNIHKAFSIRLLLSVSPPAINKFIFDKRGLPFDLYPSRSKQYCNSPSIYSTSSTCNNNADCAPHYSSLM